MVNKVSKITLEKNKIRIRFSYPLEEKMVLRDEEAGCEFVAQNVDGEATIDLQSVGSVLGNYGIFLGEDKVAAEPEDSLFRELRLKDYFYDEDRDLYMKYAKTEEGTLRIVLSRARDISGKEKIQIASVESGECFLKLQVEKQFIEQMQDGRLVILPDKNRGMWIPTQQYDFSKGILSVDLFDFIESVKTQEAERRKWRIYVEILRDGSYETYRLQSGKQIVKTEEEDFFDNRQEYMECTHIFSKGEKIYAIYPYVTKIGNISLIQMEESEKYLLKVMNRIRDIYPKKNGFTVEMELHNWKDHEIENLIFFHRTKIEEEQEMISCPIKIKEKKKDRVIGECYIDFSGIKIRPLYWDIRVVYKKDGISYPTCLNNESKKFEKKYYGSLLAGKTMTLKSGEIFYLYKTVSGHVAFQCRAKGEYDTLGFRLKERLAAFIYFALKPYWINRNIYLVYEKFCVMAQDNGYYFFQYCMENNVEKELNRRIYYIIDRNSPDWEKVAKYKDRVIPFMSLKHMVYLLASKLLISTDTIDHAYAWRPKDSILHQYLDSKKLIFLQHGVIALKQVHFLYSKNKRGRCSIFVTSNNMERDIIYDYFGYKMNQIAVTGLCRWDVLEDKSEGLREILIMPTWRNWLDEVSDEAFRESDYYHNYMSLLNSDWLRGYLEKYDLYLNFYLHPKFREYISNFKMDGDRLRLIPFGEEPLNELMMRCKLLVTDYSSVCWDVFYQGKPVIFYQFDAEQYEEAHGSYIDFERDLFGDRATKPEKLMALLEEYAQREFALKEKYAKMRKDCYKYIDKNNSKRICDEIVKRGW